MECRLVVRLIILSDNTIQMEEKLSHVDEMEGALDRRREYIEGTELPQIKEKFRNLLGTFQSIRNVLLRKSLVEEDPYKYEQKISEVTIPDDSGLAESEKSDRYSLRLSDFDTQVEFVINYYQFSTEYLTLNRIKLLAGLLKFIKWTHISENSNHYPE